MRSSRRVGLWLVGAFGGVGSTTALGLAALARGLSSPVGMVTALPRFADIDFDGPGEFVVGGHDIRATTFASAVEELHARSHVFDSHMIAACREPLAAWTKNVRPGVAFRANPAIASLADRSAIRAVTSLSEAVEEIRKDLRAFHEEHRLEQVVVVNVASTEPPVELAPEHMSLAGLRHAVEKGTATLPSSALYAMAALDAGFPYVNLTPSLGATFPALEELAKERGVPHLGRDAKTGETLLKSVLAPLFAMRNLKVLSWVGHNILGNRDGLVLNDPANKASKVKSKDALLAETLGYRPQSLVSIEYVESLDDWKTAWDHIHFEGFLGTKMTLQFTWQGCDSLLAAPLVIDLARLALLAQRRGACGAFLPAASFFKSPIGVAEHELGSQFRLLVEYLSK